VHSPSSRPPHSPAWVIQSWLSFFISVAAPALGIYCLPDDGRAGPGGTGTEATDAHMHLHGRAR